MSSLNNLRMSLILGVGLAFGLQASISPITIYNTGVTGVGQSDPNYGVVSSPLGVAGLAVPISMVCSPLLVALGHRTMRHLNGSALYPGNTLNGGNYANGFEPQVFTTSGLHSI